MFGEGGGLTDVGMGVADLLGHEILPGYYKISPEDREHNRAVAAQAIAEGLLTLQLVRKFIGG